MQAITMGVPSPLLSLLLLGVLISSASLTNPENPTDAKLADIQLSMYGRKTDLQTLFGDSVASGDVVAVINEPIVDLDPSRANLRVQSYGVDYIEINYNDRNRKRWTEIPGDDTPTAIARDLCARNKKFVVILGGPGSGKTVALTKILTVLRADPEITWSLLVNLKKAVPHPVPADWEPSRIFSETLGPKETQLFRELLERNPQKINILLDNFNLIPNFDTRKTIYQYAETLYGEGVGIVLTTSLSTGQSIPIPNHDEIKTINADRAYVETPLLKTNDAELFLTRQLELQLMSAKNHREYAKIIGKVIGEMSIPTTFENVEQVSRLIISGDKNVFVEEEFIGLREYLNSERANPAEYGEMLGSAEYNRMRLFKKLTARSVPSFKASTYYGLEALERIYSGYPLRPDYEWKLRPVTSNSDYNGNGEEFELLRHERFRSIFIYPEYDVYFAVRALFHKIETGAYVYTGIIIQILRYQFKGSQMTQFMKFIDAAVAIDESSRVQSILYSAVRAMKMYIALEYAVLAKLDSLAAGFIKTLHLSEVSEYLRRDEGKSYKSTTLHSHSEISESIMYDRQEMLFKNAMVKSATAISQMKPQKFDPKPVIWRYREFGRYADEMVQYPTKKSMQTMTMILTRAPKQLLTENFFNQRLFNVINNGDLRSRPIIEKWIQHGAVPSNVNIKGNTLVHVAVKNRDLLLLKYLVENLKVQIIDKTSSVKSLLITALDSNPMPRYSLPQFWEVMEYLMRATGGLRVPKVRSSQLKVGSVTPTAADEASPAYKLITGTNDEATLSTARSEVASSPGLVDELSLPVKQYRRNAVLSRGMNQVAVRLARDLTTQTEVLLQYRGLDPLLPDEQAAYERSIRLAIGQDVIKAKGKLTDKQLSRIRSNLVDNIGTEADYKFAINFAQTDLVTAHIEKQYVIRFVNAIEDKFIQKISPEPSLLSMTTLERGISQTRAEVYPPIDVSVNSDDFPSRPNLENRIPGSILCRSIPRRRRDTSSCLVTDQEYREIVTETQENGKIVRKISSEKFLELATVIKEKVETDKYNELVSTGRKLRESGAILEGRYQTLLLQLISTDEPRPSFGPIIRDISNVFGHESSWRNFHQNGGRLSAIADVHFPVTKGKTSGMQSIYGVYRPTNPEAHFSNRAGLYPSDRSGIQRPNLPHIPRYESSQSPSFESIRYKPSVLSVPPQFPKFSFPKIPGRNGRK